MNQLIVYIGIDRRRTLTPVGFSRSSHLPKMVSVCQQGRTPHRQVCEPHIRTRLLKVPGSTHEEELLFLLLSSWWTFVYKKASKCKQCRIFLWQHRETGWLPLVKREQKRATTRVLVPDTRKSTTNKNPTTGSIIKYFRTEALVCRRFRMIWYQNQSNRNLCSF